VETLHQGEQGQTHEQPQGHLSYVKDLVCMVREASQDRGKEQIRQWRLAVKIENAL